METRPQLTDAQIGERFVKTKPGPKPVKAAEVEVLNPKLNQDKITTAMVQMRADDIADRQSRDTDMFDLGRQVGAIQMAQVQRDFCAVAQIKLFEEIKESNKYKNLAIQAPDGSCATAQNLEEFCRLVFGASYRVMAEGSQTMGVLGQEAYEAANRLGLNRKQLRLIRSLPDAQRTAVAEAIQAESKSEVVAIIEDLAAQLAQANQDIAQSKLQAEDNAETIAAKDSQINQLNTKLKRIDNAEPEEQLALVLSETTTRAHTALAYVRGDLSLAFSKLAGFERGGANSHRHLMAGWLADLEREIAILRADYFLPQPAVTPGTGA